MKRSLLRRTNAGSSAGRVLALAALASAATTAACSSTPPPPPKPVAKPPPPVVIAAPPPLPPSRWTMSGGATEVGPKLEAGTLVLVGGRRAIVGKDGSVRAETTSSPEPLDEVIEVPMPSGGRKLVARGARGVYRLDDPLGAPKPLAQAEQDIRGIGAYAGLVAVWTYGGDMPRFVDVETGRMKPVTTLPALPLRAVAFKDGKEGAGIFDGIGLAVTADGGATWKRVSEDVKGDALRVFEVALREGALRAFVYDEGRDAPIDVAQARLGRLSEHSPKEDESPLVKWIHTTHRDPLSIAASAGVLLPDGSALVASHGMLAQVDLKSGMVTAASQFARGDGLGTCGVSRAGKHAWIACSLSEDAGGDHYDPFGVMRVSLEGGSLKPERPALVRSGETDLRTSPSGGVMLLGACSSDDDGDVCSRQPDGRWLTLRGEIDLYPRGAGPLSDGRVAFVRNIWEGDVPESERRDDEEEPHEEEQESEEGRGEEEGDREDKPVPERKRVYVAAIGEGGKEERVTTLDFQPLGELRVLSPIEEDDEHTLSFVIADDDGVYAVSQPVGKDARKPQRLQGASGARIRGGRGIAIGEDGISASKDGGKTWQSVPLPEPVRASLSDLTGMLDDPSIFGTSEVGVMLDKHVRIGWGAEEPRDERAEPPFDVTIPRAEINYGPGTDRMLTCTSEGAIQGTAPLSSASLIPQLLGKKGPAPKGTRRTVKAAPTGRNGLMDVVALFEEEGPDKPGSEPAKWTLSWHDATELSGKVRTWSGPPPKGSAWGAELRAAAGAGARALFTMRAAANKNLLVRTKAGGGVETAEVGYELLPTNEVVFGADKGEPIAWLRDTALIVWVTGEAPRIIGHVAATRGTRTLGEPTKDGIPVLLSSYDWSAMRVFPIPAAEKKGAPAPLPLAPTLDGWVTAPNVRNLVARLAPCGAKPKAGARFFVTRSYARGVMDGAGGSLSSSVYDVRVTGNDACTAGVSTLYAPDRASARPTPPPPAAGKPAPPKKGPIAFVRADFLGKKAEGGDRGLPAKDQVFKLSCALDERK